MYKKQMTLLVVLATTMSALHGVKKTKIRPNIDTRNAFNKIRTLTKTQHQEQERRCAVIREKVEKDRQERKRRRFKTLCAINLLNLELAKIKNNKNI